MSVQKKKVFRDKIMEGLSTKQKEYIYKIVFILNEGGFSDLEASGFIADLCKIESGLALGKKEGERVKKGLEIIKKFDEDPCNVDWESCCVKIF